MRLAVVSLVALAFVAGGCGGGTTTVTVTTTRTVTAASPPASATPQCAGHDLKGTFTEVPNSAGAGNVVYRLQLVNISSSPCWLAGLPQVQLNDAKGSSLPTTVRPAQPGTATSARVVVQPGGAASAEARFSPDVPGVGDQQGGQCQPTATTLGVLMADGGGVEAPITPPTPVCEHGQLSFTLYAAA